MVLQVSDVVPPTHIKITRDPDELSIDQRDMSWISSSHKEHPEKEKQISVDPISLREPSFNMILSPLPPPVDPISLREPSFNMMLSPLPPPLPLVRTKFLSCSLPNSTTTSPWYGSRHSKKKWRNGNQVGDMVRQHSAVQSYRLSSSRDNPFRKSRSYGEGRVHVSQDEIDDFWLHKPSNNVVEDRNKEIFHCGSFSRDDFKEKNVHKISTKNNVTSKSKSSNKKKDHHTHDGKFKCSALCLYLPSFGKAKQVKPTNKEEAVNNMMSGRVSLEKFECGSWASAVIVNDHEHDEEEDSGNLYFDLPMELIRGSANEAHSPINAAFVFDKDPKGVLKNPSMKGTPRKSNESPRHVRFSSTSPMSYPASPTTATCITPRLRKAREDFQAFLETQRA